VGACCFFLGAQALRGKHCARLILMFCLFCLDARLNEGFFLFSLRTERTRRPTACVTAWAPTLYKGSVIECHEGFLSWQWQGSCSQSPHSYCIMLLFRLNGSCFYRAIQLEPGILRKESYLCTYFYCIHTDSDILRKWYHTYQEILTDADRKIPTRDATLKNIPCESILASVFCRCTNVDF